jgi:glycosyltransferase involved in cell wall biosynthesis
MLVFGAELIKRGFEVDLVLSKREGALDGGIPNGLRVVDLASSRMLKAVPRLISYLKQRQPRAIYATITHANLAAMSAARCAGISAPVVLRQSNTPLSETKDSWGRLIASRMIPLVYSKASAIIAVSEGVRDELIELSPSLQPLTHVLPTPVLTSDIIDQSKQETPHPWLRDRSVPVVLSAGRFKPHKGMLNLIRAFKLVRQARPARLIILGDGPERARLEAEVAQLGLADDVAMPGFFPNPFVWMRRSSLFVLASHYEGLPNVLIQALGVGTPVVATDCPSGPAEILENGRFGALVPVNNDQRLAEAINKALSTAPSSDGQRVVWERYGAEAATSKYLQLAGLPLNQPGAFQTI